MSRTVASPRPHISSITSCSSGCRAGGAEMTRSSLEAEGPLDRVALAALGDGPGGSVVPGFHPLQGAALEVDDLAGHDRDLRDRRVARRRAGDRDRAADRVERVADV